MAQLMLKQKGIEKEDKATDVEALAYLYTAGLSGPLPDDYSGIFMYLTRKSFDWQGKKEIPEYLKEYESIDDYKLSLLNELKRHIWYAQEKTYKERTKAERKDNDKKYPNTVFEQLKLF